MFDELQESSFSPADWAEVVKLKGAFQRGGQDALMKALEELVHSNRAGYLAILEVLNPGYGKWQEEMVAERGAVQKGGENK